METLSFEKVAHFCPISLTSASALTLQLVDAERYEQDGDNPSFRIYRLICLDCGVELTKYVTKNTLAAVKILRDEIDRLYGKPKVFPSWLFYNGKERKGA